MPNLDLFSTRLLKVALMNNSSHCRIYFETILLTFSTIQVWLMSAMIIVMIIRTIMILIAATDLTVPTQSED